MCTKLRHCIRAQTEGIQEKKQQVERLEDQIRELQTRRVSLSIETLRLDIYIYFLSCMYHSEAKAQNPVTTYFHQLLFVTSPEY